MATNGLRGRVEALEQAVAVVEGLPCIDCGLGHVDDVLTLDRLADRYQGVRDLVPAICGCACCEPVLRDLAAQLARVDGAA